MFKVHLAGAKPSRVKGAKACEVLKGKLERLVYFSFSLCVSFRVLMSSYPIFPFSVIQVVNSLICKIL